MAEQEITLEPSESRVVSFEATPTKAKTYHVSVDGLSGSFEALLAPVSLSGVVTNAITGSPIAGVKILYDGRQSYTNASGAYRIAGLEVGSLSVAFSHIDYEAYHTEITLSLGENTLVAALTPAVTGEIALEGGRYNLVTYTGRRQSAAEAFASVAGYVSVVQHFVNSEYYENVLPLNPTSMMIPGDNYWVFAREDCIWTF